MTWSYNRIFSCFHRQLYVFPKTQSRFWGLHFPHHNCYSIYFMQKVVSIGKTEQFQWLFVLFSPICLVNQLLCLKWKPLTFEILNIIQFNSASIYCSYFIHSNYHLVNTARFLLNEGLAIKPSSYIIDTY